MQRPMTKAMATMITVFEEGDGMISGTYGEDYRIRCIGGGSLLLL